MGLGSHVNGDGLAGGATLFELGCEVVDDGLGGVFAEANSVRTKFEDPSCLRDWHGFVTFVPMIEAFFELECGADGVTHGDGAEGFEFGEALSITDVGVVLIIRYKLSEGRVLGGEVGDGLG